MHLLSWILAVPLALTTFGVFAELCARFWIRWRGLYYVWSPGMRLLLHLDREVLPTLEPLVRWQVNRVGERGGDPPKKRQGTYRILVAGGSPAEGYFLDQASTWASVLQTLLLQPDHLQALGVQRVHVGNVGRSRVGSQELALIFDKILPRYPHLDAIIIMVGGSDIISWLEVGAPVIWGPSHVQPASAFNCHPEGPYRWAPRQMALTELLRRLRSRWVPEVREETGKTLGRLRQKRQRAKEIRTEVPDPTVLLTHFERYFSIAIARARRHANRVIVACQPCFDKDHTPEEEALEWNFPVGNPYTEKTTIYYSLRVVGRLMALINDRAVRVARSMGVEHLDLMPVLERSSRTYYDFIHFTPFGAAAVGEAIADKILSRPVGRESDAQISLERGRSCPREGARSPSRH
jgi:lysophospholipase L1-like esterase